MADQFFLIDFGGQRWPVVHIPEKALDPEDKVAMPAVDYVFPVLAVERNYDMLVLVVRENRQWQI